MLLLLLVCIFDTFRGATRLNLPDSHSFILKQIKQSDESTRAQDLLHAICLSPNESKTSCSALANSDVRILHEVAFECRFLKLSRFACTENATTSLPLLPPTCNKVTRADMMPHATHCSYANLELSSSCAARSAFCRTSKSSDLSCPICHSHKSL